MCHGLLKMMSVRRNCQRSEQITKEVFPSLRYFLQILKAEKSALLVAALLLYFVAFSFIGIIQRDITSAGTLLWIYRRLIGRSYIVFAGQDKYIGSTRKTQILIILVFVAVLHFHLYHFHIAK